MVILEFVVIKGCLDLVRVFGALSFLLGTVPTRGGTIKPGEFGSYTQTGEAPVNPFEFVGRVRVSQPGCPT